MMTNWSKTRILNWKTKAIDHLKTTLKSGDGDCIVRVKGNLADAIYPQQLCTDWRMKLFKKYRRS